jgi:hypothetical protein
VGLLRDTRLIWLLVSVVGSAGALEFQKGSKRGQSND